MREHGPLYVLSGPVIHGRGNGRTVGMPTANLPVPPGAALPPFGVYAARVRVGDREYLGVTNVGLRPTRKMASLREVEAQVEKDAEEARRLLGGNGM